MTEVVRPKQLRALLALLVLVPFIPLALMVRFMADSLRVESIAAQDGIQQAQAGLVGSALARYKAPADIDSDFERARGIVNLIDGGAESDPRVTSRVLAANGTLLAGQPNPWGQPLLSTPAPGIAGGMLHCHLAGPWVLSQATADQRNYLVLTGILSALVVLGIAGTAAFALNRRILLSELRNTSVATVAHELRTPLASMRMLVDTLREGRYRGEGQLREYLDLVAAENERLTRLAENFLTFSRLERDVHPLALGRVTPAEVAAQAIAPLRARLDAAAFTLQVPDSLPKMEADRDALAQVLGNLLENALKYTGGDKRITLRARQEGTRVVFEVEDNGIGIPPGTRGEIFRPFYQVDQKLSRSREGCGLGLAIARRIVVAHGGEISVAPAGEQGSIFTVKIPIA